MHATCFQVRQLRVSSYDQFGLTLDIVRKDTLTGVIIADSLTLFEMPEDVRQRLIENFSDELTKIDRDHVIKPAARDEPGAA